MKVVVKIEPEDNALVESRYFEHAAGKDNIAFLMRDDQIKWSTLQHYIDVVETRYYMLEKTKEQISRKYCPEDFKDASYTYSFNFENESIVYELA